MKLGPNTKHILENINMKCSYKAISVNLLDFYQLDYVDPKEFLHILTISELLHPKSYNLLQASYKDFEYDSAKLEECEYDVSKLDKLSIVYFVEHYPFEMNMRHRLVDLYSMYCRLNKDSYDLISVITYAKCEFPTVFNKFNTHPTSKIICSLITDDLTSVLTLMNDPRNNNYLLYEIARQCSSNEIINKLTYEICLRNFLELEVLTKIDPNSNIPRTLHLYIRQIV